MELIPEELWNTPQVREYAKHQGKNARECLLNASELGQAMLGLKDGSVRGKPEVIHACLLVALESIAFRQGNINVFVHTRNDKVLRFNQKFRVPRSFKNFISNMEGLFENKQIPPEGEAGVTLEDKTLKNLIKELRPSKIIILSRNGRKSAYKTLINKIKRGSPLVIVGGFSDRDFSNRTLSLADETLRLDDSQLMAWTVVGMLCHAYSL